MRLLAATGYADWQRYPARVGGNLLPASTVSLSAGTKKYGPWAVTGWSGISVVFEPSTGYGTVTFNWWEESGEVNKIEYRPWNVSTDTFLVVTMPAFGPWLSLDVDVLAAGGMDAKASVRGIGTGGPDIRYPVTVNPAHVDNQSVAASASYFLQPKYVRKGLCYVNIQPGDTAGKMAYSLDVMNADGSENYGVAYWGLLTAIYSDLIVVPDDMIGLHVYNQDTTTAHTFSARMTFS